MYNHFRPTGQVIPEHLSVGNLGSLEIKYEWAVENGAFPVFDKEVGKSTHSLHFSKITIQTKYPYESGYSMMELPYLSDGNYYLRATSAVYQGVYKEFDGTKLFVSENHKLVGKEQELSTTSHITLPSRNGIPEIDINFSAVLDPQLSEVSGQSLSVRIGGQEGFVVMPNTLPQSVERFHLDATVRMTDLRAMPYNKEHDVMVFLDKETNKPMCYRCSRFRTHTDFMFSYQGRMLSISFPVPVMKDFSSSRISVQTMEKFSLGVPPVLYRPELVMTSAIGWN